MSNINEFFEFFSLAQKYIKESKTATFDDKKLKTKFKITKKYIIKNHNDTFKLKKPAENSKMKGQSQLLTIQMKHDVKKQ
jgi:hypothetical protein